MSGPQSILSNADNHPDAISFPSRASPPVGTGAISSPPPPLPALTPFPASPQAPVPAMHVPNPAHLRPFRRISLPSSSSPNAGHRMSVASVASFDSVREEEGEGGPGYFDYGRARLGSGVKMQSSPVRGSSVGAGMGGGGSPGGSNVNGVVNKRHSQSPRPKSRPTSGMGMPRARTTSTRSHMSVSSHPLNESMQAKRRKVVMEIYETERAYVDGLEMIYNHFLTPLIASLDSPYPLLSRDQLTSIFSNFIDIWNFHRSFFSSFTALLSPSIAPPFPSSPSVYSPTLLDSNGLPPISELLSSHFPYLSLYTPFVTAFPAATSALISLTVSNPAFGAFMKGQEADPCCKKLGLRDWLLTVVQRCPRYLLLLKDLISCIDTNDAEYATLNNVLILVSKINTSFNTSLHSQAVTVALLALQRATPNLPFPLVSPGRTLVKRGSLVKVDRGSEHRLREILLFSDCLVWLSRGGEREWVGGVSMGMGVGVDRAARARSPSDTEQRLSRPRSMSSVLLTSAPAQESEEKWWYRGRVELIDLEVVVSPSAFGEESAFEVFSPESSFVLHASSPEERDEWVGAVRRAKTALLTSLRVKYPNSTLSSSAATTHLRRALKALPYNPSAPSEADGKGKEQERSRMGQVDHFVPAIWVPDGRAAACMRCGERFGWRRRRHHCRLCGKVVCSSCSGSTFYIADQSGKTKSSPKAARACNACYDAVFPPIPAQTSPVIQTSSSAPSFPSSSTIRALSSIIPKSSSTRFDIPQLRTPESKRQSVSFHMPMESYSTSDLPRQASASLAQPSTPPRRFLLPKKQPSYSTPPHTRLMSSSKDNLSLLSSPDGDDYDSPDFSLPPSPTKARISILPLASAGLHVTPVMTRPSSRGEGRSRRYSLVLGGTETVKPKRFGRGVGVAAELSELLGREKENS
ncbi:hypothetical protein BOTBODRAFT_31546 [Botryobasidium botryosum FD-172 SS1]|uniref:FYVE-type domain-containing protein n=1 Tax=Botryobasidium botryosum (strain FD-172 SS1) TaxID=930990 RepID=A0A067MUV1_BOTB1|nr:hypothetical protein BOTBODRAFT_31546 [Botryobasidium botryosum FD-172 SS1]